MVNTRGRQGDGSSVCEVRRQKNRPLVFLRIRYRIGYSIFTSFLVVLFIAVYGIDLVYRIIDDLRNLFLEFGLYKAF